MVEKDETKPSEQAFPTLTDQQCVQALTLLDRVTVTGVQEAAALVDVTKSIALIRAAHGAQKQAKG